MENRNKINDKKLYCGNREKKLIKPLQFLFLICRAL